VDVPDALGGETARLAAPLDLVIDHAGAESQAIGPFVEVLCGRIEPDGLYVVDGSVPVDTVLRLMLSTVRTSDLVRRVELGPGFLTLRRGSRPASTDRWNLIAAVSDPFGVLVNARRC
jgi:hypothetical protein